MIPRHQTPLNLDARLFRVRRRTWAQAEKFFREHGAGQRPMLELVRRIAASPYAADLHVATSRAALPLSPSPEFAWETGCLRISYDATEDARGVMLLYSAAGPAPPRETRATVETAAEAVERLLADRWFSPYRAGTAPARDAV
jgi:hypothetical protein